MLASRIFTHLLEAIGKAQSHNSCTDNEDGLCRHPMRGDQVSTIMSESLLFVLPPAFTNCSRTSSSFSSLQWLSASVQCRTIYCSLMTVVFVVIIGSKWC